MACRTTDLTVTFFPKAGNPFSERVMAADMSIRKYELEAKVQPVIANKSFDTLLNWFNGFDTIYVSVDNIRAQLETSGGYAGIERVKFDYNYKDPYEGEREKWSLVFEL